MEMIVSPLRAEIPDVVEAFAAVQDLVEARLGAESIVPQPALTVWMGDVLGSLDDHESFGQDTRV